MEFTFETEYNQKALTIMARSLRKTIRKKKSRRSHIWGWIIVVLAIILSLTGDEGIISVRSVVTWLVTIILIVTLIWEDAINGFVARKRMLPGTEKSVGVFREDGYETTTDAGRTEWKYEKILHLAETKDYFVFIFSKMHVQLQDKNSISGGTVEEFRAFIEKVTDKKVEQIK